ncbi:MAG: DegT/DnrJ/EryC1/StrS family aminotransferase, partial [Deltaproteobacteria bacterium]|nr:DegT/DnrJ/EryC1/StrS family aminotransferase [Deltaproteobacteria bacterium]
ITPITFMGAISVFIDSDSPSWNTDLDLLAEEVEDRAGSGKVPKAIIITDLYGQCADYDRILEVCAPYQIPVIIDAAEAVGATYKGRHAGKGARAAVYSFNGNKIITTSGGGLLASDDDKLINSARFFSQQAREPFSHYEHKVIGYNYRMSNILAAIGLGQLKVLDDRVRRKREIFGYYKQALSGLPGIEFMPEAPYGKSNRWLTVILIKPEEFGAHRETVRLALEEENIESRPIWKPMHLQPVFRDCHICGGAISERLFELGLCLPSGTALTDQDLERVVAVIKNCCRGKS